MANPDDDEPSESLSHTTRLVWMAGLALAVRRLLGHVEDAAFAELLGVMKHRRLRRGETFFVAGEAPDALGIVLAGRLRLVAPREATVPLEVAPGECVGESEVVTGRTREHTAMAMRDSLLAVCSRDDFLGFARRYPDALFGLVGQIADRAISRTSSGAPAGRRGEQGATIALVTRGQGAIAEFARAVAESARSMVGASVMFRETLWRNSQTAEQAAIEGRTAFSRHFDDLGAAGNHVLLVADGDVDAWMERCVRQADRIVLIAGADGDPRRDVLDDKIDQWLGGATVPSLLVLVHTNRVRAPRGTASWLSARPRWRHLHVRESSVADVDRVARTLVGRSVGIVLGGGGARGGAHIGVLESLIDQRVPIDVIGGTSAGAGIAAMVAYGYSPAEIRDRLWESFVQRRPLRRWTLPMYGLLDHRVLDATARSLCGSVDIEDLWLPFYCVSCDISGARKVVHRSGPLWRALRATTAVPGLVAPMVTRDGVLVDGGILSNVPVDEMREVSQGPVVAVDVSPLAPMVLDFDYDRLPSPFAALWARLWRRFVGERPASRLPSIGETLLRSVSISSQMERATLDARAELVLRPPVAEFSPADFSALDELSAVARQAVSAPVASWVRESGVASWGRVSSTERAG